MGRPKKLNSPVTLFCAIDEKIHKKLRTRAWKEKCSMADLVRKAIKNLLS